MISYFPAWLSVEEAAVLQAAAERFPFEPREVKVWDKIHPLPRLTCFFSDNQTGYHYSGQTTPGNPWPTELLEIRAKLETQCGCVFGACLGNLYRSGNDTVGWHRDNDHIFNTKLIIASLSVGCTRRFRMRNRATGEKEDFELAAGSLLIFTDEHVSSWEHQVPRTAKETGQRINFTFRSTD